MRQVTSSRLQSQRAVPTRVDTSCRDQSRQVACGHVHSPASLTCSRGLSKVSHDLACEFWREQSRWDCSHQQGECTQDASVLDVQSRAVARSRSGTCWRALAGTGAYAQFATLAPTGQLWRCGRVAHPETFAVAVASRREQPRAFTVQSQAVASFAVAVVYRHELSLAVVLRPRAVLASREQSRDVSSIL